MNHWISWEGGVDLIAKTDETLAMPNVIVHVARIVHTPVGSAPGGMLFWQPDATAPPQVFGFVSTDATVAAYFANHIFVGTPFEGAPALVGTIDVRITAEQATSRVEIPGFVFESHLAEFRETTLIQRPPLATAPFHQQGLESPAGHACLKVNGGEVTIAIPPAGMTGGPCALVSPCGIYAR